MTSLNEVNITYSMQKLYTLYYNVYKFHIKNNAPNYISKWDQTSQDATPIATALFFIDL